MTSAGDSFPPVAALAEHGIERKSMDDAMVIRAEKRIALDDLIRNSIIRE
ncbi:MAG: hypothetical protein ACE5OP_13840 [Candidatus Glassbacteria bacterium]